MTSTAVPAARTAPSTDERLRIAPPTVVHDVRVRAAAAVLAGEDVAEVAARHEVDTQTLLGWAERLARGGAAAVTAEAAVVAEPEIPCDAGVTAPHVPVEDYLAVVAHEFRTPLTAARSGLWVLGREDVDPVVRAEVSGVVQERLGSLDRMCADVLDAVRVAPTARRARRPAGLPGRGRPA